MMQKIVEKTTYLALQVYNNMNPVNAKVIFNCNARGLRCTQKTADSDTVSTYQVSSVQLVTDKKLEAFDKA